MHIPRNRIPYSVTRRPVTPAPFPAWVEMPPYIKGNPQRCNVSGLCHTSLRRLVEPSHHNNMNPPVISKMIIIPGAKRGRRMINTASLLAWMDAKEAKKSSPSA